MAGLYQRQADVEGRLLAGSLDAAPTSGISSSQRWSDPMSSGPKDLSYTTIRLNQASPPRQHLLFSSGFSPQTDSCLVSPSSSSSEAVPFDQLDLVALTTPEGTLVCPVCSKRIGERHHFKRHYMIHTGEKPHACAFCAYRASRKEEVKYHVLRKHPDLLHLYN